MSEKQRDKETYSEPIDNKLLIDVTGILHKIIDIRKILYKAAGIGFVVGIIIALSIPKQYSVIVKLSPEIGNSKGNNALAGLAASFLGNGVTTGDSPDALNTSLSADIITSTPFLLELLDTNITTCSENEDITLRTYLNKQSTPWWNYIFNIPRIIINRINSLFGINNNETTINDTKLNLIRLSKEDSKKINYLKKNIITFVDKKTSITNISITLQEATVTAIVANSIAEKLQEYITSYRTSKAKEDFSYLEKLFKDRQQEYYTAQKKYADYMDANDNLILESIRTEQDRLQNDMNLAFQVYSQVANQLQIARAKVQEEKPVFAIVEPAVIPSQPSGVGIKVYALLFTFLSISTTCCWILIGGKTLNKIKTKQKTEK